MASTCIEPTARAGLELHHVTNVPTVRDRHDGWAAAIPRIKAAQSLGNSAPPHQLRWRVGLSTLSAPRRPRVHVVVQSSSTVDPHLRGRVAGAVLRTQGI